MPFAPIKKNQALKNEHHSTHLKFRGKWLQQKDKSELYRVSGILPV